MTQDDTSPRTRSSTGLSAVLDETCWDGRKLKLGDVEFETDQREWPDWNHDQERFFLFKPPNMLRAYARFWANRGLPSNVVELGIWEGGSAAFWFEVFAPRKLVALDLMAAHRQRAFLRIRAKP
jgi:hypothetical protein